MARLPDTCPACGGSGLSCAFGKGSLALVKHNTSQCQACEGSGKLVDVLLSGPNPKTSYVPIKVHFQDGTTKELDIPRRFAQERVTTDHPKTGQDVDCVLKTVNNGTYIYQELAKRQK